MHKDYHVKKGIKYWSVTSILEIINRPDLNYLRGFKGNEEMDHIMQEAGQIGIDFHALAVEVIKKKGFIAVQDKPEFYMKMFTEFQTWVLENVEATKFLEKRFFSEEHGFTGRIDGLYKLKGKKLFDIVDIKTGKTGHYVENMQSAAYKMMLKENGIKVGDRIILKCSKKGTPVKAEKIKTSCEDDFYNFLYAKSLYLKCNKIN